MKIKRKIETLKYTIGRYDHYYDSVNNKGNLYLSLNTFLLGGIVTGYYSIKNNIENDFCLLFFVSISIIFCLLSIGYSLWAIMPYLSRQGDSKNGSVLYFGNTANISHQCFTQMYNDMTNKSLYEDYMQQAHLLAISLHKKFNRLKIATFLLGGCFMCIIIIGLKILN